MKSWRKVNSTSRSGLSVIFSQPEHLPLQVWFEVGLSACTMSRTVGDVWLSEQAPQSAQRPRYPCGSL
jgi:hypothetical protein